jgi:hypothetical protein
MKKILLFIALVLGSISYGQNIKVEGVIQDISKAPLEMANVMAVNQATKAMDVHTITDKGNIV